MDATAVVTPHVTSCDHPGSSTSNLWGRRNSDKAAQKNPKPKHSSLNHHTPQTRQGSFTITTATTTATTLFPQMSPQLGGHREGNAFDSYFRNCTGVEGSSHGVSVETRTLDSDRVRATGHRQVGSDRPVLPRQRRHQLGRVLSRSQLGGNLSILAKLASLSESHSAPPLMYN